MRKNEKSGTIEMTGAMMTALYPWFKKLGKQPMGSSLMLQAYQDGLRVKIISPEQVSKVFKILSPRMKQSSSRGVNRKRVR